MKIAVIADIHLPGRCDTVKEEIFHWAIQEAVAQNVDLIAGAGDLTALGETVAAKRIMEALRASGKPFISTPGNAELRSPEQTGELLQIMATADSFGAVRCVDSSRGKLSGASSAFLREIAAGCERNLLLISHCPATEWNDDDREVLEKMIADGIIGKFVYGHKHIDISNGIYECVRGLDPDKASGGAPALVFFSNDNAENLWMRKDVVCPLAHAAAFPANVRRKIWNSFGMSGMKTPIESLYFAAERKLPVFEIRFAGAEDFPSAELLEAVAVWRRNGGRYLSLHMPDLKFNGTEFSGTVALEIASQAAVKLGCNGVTLHVPRCFADELDSQAKIAEAAQITAKHIALLFEHDISVGIENLHTSAEERKNKRYKFGCVARECMAFINALREIHPDKKIGLHLDIGHARNNMPFCRRETLSDWYAECGREIVAMHIHQVSRAPDGELRNHTGFEDFYGMLISLSSLAMARKSGQIGEVPMILELRCPVERSLEVLAAELCGVQP